MRKYLVVILSMLMIAAFAAGAGAEDQVFKAGVITSLSGDLAMGGNLTKRGYDMWAEKINEMGGIEVGGQKYKVKMFYADAQSQPSAAASAADRLITQDKVDFIFGPYASGITKAAAPIMDKYKVVMITGSAESPALWTQDPPFEFTFGSIPPASYTGPAAVDALATQLDDPPKTALVYGLNDAFSKPTAQVYKATCEKHGIKILKYADDLPAKSDLTFIATLAKSMRPDLICLAGHEEDLINMVKVLAQVNYTPKALAMHYGVTNPGFAEALGKNANGVLGGSVWTERMELKGQLWPDPKAYAKAALEKYDVPADYTQAACSATGVVFQQALAELGSAPPLSEEDRVKLKEIIETISVDTFYGTLDYATEGQFRHANVGLDALAIQITDGEVMVVGPSSQAETELVYPMVPWNER